MIVQSDSALFEVQPYAIFREHRYFFLDKKNIPFAVRNSMASLIVSNSKNDLTNSILTCFPKLFGKPEKITSWKLSAEPRSSISAKTDLSAFPGARPYYSYTSQTLFLYSR
jgi:hypothetical protein